MYLLDTNVLSELRKKNSGRMNASVLRWTETFSPVLMYISAISVLELETGILQMERRGAIQGKALRTWFTGSVLPVFEGRILTVDHHVARRYAAMRIPDPRPFGDALIGASAAVHGFTLVTRNVRDFEGMGIELLDPWSP